MKEKGKADHFLLISQKGDCVRYSLVIFFVLVFLGKVCPGEPCEKRDCKQNEKMITCKNGERYQTKRWQCIAGGEAEIKQELFVRSTWDNNRYRFAFDEKKSVLELKQDIEQSLGKVAVCLLCCVLGAESMFMWGRFDRYISGCVG